MCVSFGANFELAYKGNNSFLFILSSLFPFFSLDIFLNFWFGIVIEKMVKIILFAIGNNWHSTDYKKLPNNFRFWIFLSCGDLIESFQSIFLHRLIQGEKVLCSKPQMGPLHRSWIWMEFSALIPLNNKTKSHQIKWNCNTKIML